MKCLVKTVVVFILLSAAAAQNAANPKRLWSVDLSKDSDFQTRLKASETVLRPPTLDFVSNEQIIVSFDDNVPTMDMPIMNPFGFHVLQVSSDSGKVGKRLLFEVLNDTSQAVPTSSGGFVVLAGEKLQKYSNTFEKGLGIPTPLNLHGQPTKMIFTDRVFFNPHYEMWQVDVAPSGQQLVLTHRETPKQMEISWVRSSDFTVVATQKVKPSRYVSGGDDSALLWDLKSRVTSDGKQTPFCVGSVQCWRAYFVTDDLLLLDEGKQYEIVTLGGKRLAGGHLNVNISQFSRSMNAPRFAYATGHYKGSGFPIQTQFAPEMRVGIFDWGRMKQVAEISFAKPEQPVMTGFRQSAIALSHDGRSVAVLIDSVLSLYQLPE